MSMLWVGTSDIGIDRFKPVGEPFLDQSAERSIDDGAEIP
jgi:hypothetical protein